jgi:hypothetical protein
LLQTLLDLHKHFQELRKKAVQVLTILLNRIPEAEESVLKEKKFLLYVP